MNGSHARAIHREVPRLELTPEQRVGIEQSVPGGADNIAAVYPLAPLQEAMLFDALLNEQQDGDPYVVPTLLALPSREQLPALAAAFQKVIDRHEALRSAVFWQDLPQPVHVVFRDAPLPVAELVFDEGRDPLQQLEEKMQPARSTMDLRRAPLVRLDVVPPIAGEPCYVLFQLHHLIADFECWKVILNEVAACLEGRELQLPVPVSYSEYVAQATSLAHTDQAQSFFRQRLADVTETTAPFGVIQLGATARGSRIVEARQVIEPAISQRIRTVAKSAGVSTARLFHAAWALVVAHTSGRNDVVFGTVVMTARQSAAGKQRLGIFVNTLPLRLQLEGASATQLMEQTHRELNETLSYKHSPLTLVQRCCGITDGAPLFTALLNYRHAEDRVGSDELGSSGIRVLRRVDATNYPIAMAVDSFADRFVLTAQTDRQIDPQRVAGYLASAVQSLVDALQDAPHTPVLTLSILPEEERHRIIESFNATQRHFAYDQLINGVFEEQVKRTPTALAVCCDGRSITYAELNRRANQLARYLRRKGVGADSLVGICLDRSPAMIVGLLGILKAGGAYVPLDPEYPVERLRHALQDAAPTALVTTDKLRSLLPADGIPVIALDSQWPEILEQHDSDLSTPSMGLHASGLAYVIYTSGSTGLPKGVMIEHRAVLNLWRGLERLYEKCGSCQRVALNASLNFDASVQQLVQLLAGRSIFIVPQETRCDAALLVKFLEEHGIEGIDCTPSQLKGWIGAGLLRNDNVALRMVLVGGEAIDPDLWRTLADCASTQFFNVYGPTECTVDSTAAHLNGDTSAPHIGRAMDNRRIYILDRHRRPVPVGVTGEIHIGGEGVARGYLNRPELTDERFVADPFSELPARMYRTGDLGRWRADGTIEYLGRNDDQVKVRGFRIELGEVEAQLALHPQVQEAVVVAHEHVPGGTRLVAYVVLSAPPTHVDDDGLRVHLRRMLPEHMIPSAFVLLERMPLTPSGKVDRRALPAPGPGAYRRREYEQPQGEVEDMLAGIWQALLQVDRVGRHDNFFELGGHSLLIVQLMERLRRMGLSTEVRRVFANPTLAGLASVLTREVVEHFAVPPNLIPADCTAITPRMLPLIELEQRHIEHIAARVPGGMANIQDIYPLAPLQEGILFHHLMNERGGDAYVIPVVLKVATRQRVDDLIGAVQALIDRHEILRTAVLWEQLPQPVQVVHRRAQLPVEEVELDEADAEAQIGAWLELERQHMDLRRAPLMRLTIAADRASSVWYVLWQFHHIVDDATSWKIMTSEIVAHLQGETQWLRESIPYRNHVAQSLAYARGGEVEEFFGRKLADVEEPTAAFGLLDVYGRGRQIDEATTQLDLALASRLRAQAGCLGVSAATLFHVAWALVVAHTSGRDDIVFGTVLLGRLSGNSDTQSILGMFINTLPLRLQLRGVATAELVERAQRELVELLGHEQASLAVAQRCSRISGTAPLFNTLLNYRHSIGSIGSYFADAQGVDLVASRAGTNYPIALSIDDLGHGFSLTAQTDPRIDAPRIIAYMGKAVQSLVAALEEAPQTPALLLPILPAEELRRVTESFNALRWIYPREKLVHQLFEEQVERTPHAKAVMHGPVSVTYRELNTRANRLAGQLRQRGVEPDQPVAVCAERSVEMVVGVLAILKAGGAYLPLDPNYPSERLQQMLDDAVPRVLLTQRELEARLPGTTAQLVFLDELAADEAPDAAVNPSIDGLSSQNLLYVIYTSGSTGRPKGTAMPHRAMVNLIDWHCRILPLAIEERVLQFAALSFDVAFQETFSTLCGGGTLVLLDEWVRRDALALLDLVTSQRIQRLFVPPLMLQSLAECANARNRLPHALKDVITAGEQLRISPDVVEFFVRLNGARLHNHYGPTETHVVTVLTLSGAPGQWPALPSIGMPIANTQIYILDPQRQPAPSGVPGEIYIAGANVARGYLNRPTLTDERFVVDPFSAEPHARMYRTGDLGRWREDGQIEYLGRNDHQVKIRGFRVELSEIEAQLAVYERVKEAAVVAREDVPGGKRLVAYVTSRDENELSIEELRNQIRRALPEYMVPSAFVMLEKMPLTPSGKLNRRALPAPELEAYAGKHYAAPQGAAEERLAEIWRHLLQVGRVGRDDDFFELGGHSLLALKLLLTINQAFDCDLKVTDVYQSPTIAGLALRVSGASTADDLVDLAHEALLSESIAQTRPPRVPARSILLTGATGFVGRFLLAELLDVGDAVVYCHVRAPSQRQAEMRLRTTMMRWDLWRDEYQTRVIAIPGDLRRPQLGIEAATYRHLCATVDSIYHCGTSMNHLETYAMAKSANVEATRELLQLATEQRPKLVNCISTLGVFSPGTSDGLRVVDERTSIDDEKHSQTQGYVASKWVAEKIVKTAMERGIACNIFRLGLMWGDSQVGRYDELQRGYRVLKSCLLSGFGIRDYLRYEMPFTPVDCAARALVSLVSRHPNGGGVFHVSSPEQYSDALFEHYNEFARAPLQLLPFYDWIREMKRLHERGLSLPVIPLIQLAFAMDETSFYAQYQRRRANLQIEFARTLRELDSAGISMRPFDDQLLRLCVADMASRGAGLGESVELEGATAAFSEQRGVDRADVRRWGMQS